MKKHRLGWLPSEKNDKRRKKKKQGKMTRKRNR